jgi:branched-chain amino acid transport system ATP-binding protein
MLEVERIEAAYGSAIALRGVSLVVERGDMVGVLGANGAGKSTLLKVISGQLRPTRGAVRFEGSSIVGRRPETIVQRGIALVPEGRHVFPSLTVDENLRIGAATRKDRHDVDADRQEMFGRFPILRDRLQQAAGTLSGGEQQQLAIARALMSRPRLLMLDEPSLGLAPIIVDEVFRMIAVLRERGITVLMVEQHVRRTLEIVDHAYLMNTGTIEFAGKPDELLRHADVESAYLGRRN